jgi:hypothetical protein
MPAQPHYLRFAWWNLHNFAHFDPTQVSAERWPGSQEEYAEKCRRVDAALRDLDARHPIDLLGLCEVTGIAAEELRARVFPSHDLLFVSDQTTFQVAVIYRRGLGLRKLLPLIAADVPETTRVMPAVQIVRPGYRIRFTFCHWTAYGDNVARVRRQLAATLAGETYEFLREPGVATRPHVVILGDLNVEPFGELFEEELLAFRDRERSQQVPHHTDKAVRRIRLYNAGWRLLGEQHPHTSGVRREQLAGTYYHQASRRWHTYDQLLVSGGLLGENPPYLDEEGVAIMVAKGCLGPTGKPQPFHWENGQATGLSDHLPVIGQLVLAGS